MYLTRAWLSLYTTYSSCTVTHRMLGYNNTAYVAAVSAELSLAAVLAASCLSSLEQIHAAGHYCFALQGGQCWQGAAKLFLVLAALCHRACS